MSSNRRALQDLLRCLRGGPVASTADWNAILAVANDHLLTPALWGALQRFGRTEMPPAEVAAYLAMVGGLNEERNRALRRQAMELATAFNRRGVRPAFLKGGLALLAGAPEAMGSRMMRDLDILVPGERRAECVAVLAEAGYSLMRGYGEGHNAVGDFARPGDAGSVDLHVELLDQPWLLAARDVWRRASILEVEGATIAVPSPTDTVLHELLHAQVHHLGQFYRGELRLLQIHALVRLVRHHGVAIDWPAIERDLDRHRLTTALHSYLLAAQRMFGLAWPLLRSPTAAARLHYWRCGLQLGSSAVQALGTRWGNLRGGLAWHRMRALYGEGSTWRWRGRHAAAFLRKQGVDGALARWGRNTS
jgi:hypothetical protein